MLCRPDPTLNTPSTDGRKSIDACSLTTTSTTTTSSTLLDEKALVPAPATLVGKRSFLDRLLGRNKKRPLPTEVEQQSAEKTKLIDIDGEASFLIKKACPIIGRRLPVWRGETIKTQADANNYDWDQTYMHKSEGPSSQVPVAFYQRSRRLGYRIYTHYRASGVHALSSKQLYERAEKFTPIGTADFAIKLFDPDTETYHEQVLARDDDRAVHYFTVFYDIFAIENGTCGDRLPTTCPSKGQMYILNKFDKHGDLRTAVCMYV